MNLILPEHLRPWQKKKIQRDQEEYMKRIVKLADDFIQLMSKEGMSVADVSILTKTINEKLAQSYATKKISEVIKNAEETNEMYPQSESPKQEEKS